MNTVEEIKYLGVTLTQYVSINYTKELGKNPVPSSMKYKIYSATARELPHTLLQTHRSPPNHGDTDEWSLAHALCA